MFVWAQATHSHCIYILIQLFKCCPWTISAEPAGMSGRTTFLDPWIENRIWNLKICFINTHPPIHRESFACYISSVAQRPQGRTVDLSREKTTALSCQASLIARVKESNTRRPQVRETSGQVQKGVVTVEMSVLTASGETAPPPV